MSACPSWTHRQRVVDIVLANEQNQETWVELKSLQASQDKPTKATTHKFDIWALMPEHRSDNAAEYHRQYVVDRMASGHSMSWSVNLVNNTRQDVFEVIDFRWRFDKFKIKHKGEIKQNVDLGATSNKKTILGAFNQDPKHGSFKDALQYFKDNTSNNPASTAKLSSFIELKDALTAVGSEVVGDAIEEFDENFNAL